MLPAELVLGRVASNKPSFCQSNEKSKCFMEKELWQIVRAIGLGKTRPGDSSVEG
jgi:hypothetical protein